MRLLTLWLVMLGGVATAVAQGEIISAPYGPPSQANQWEKFTIPLTAEAFGVSEDQFGAVMSDVRMFRIRTEMQDGVDIGGIDRVIIGDRFSSDFDSGLEGWSAAGDGTMEWIPAGGISDGYLQISDWASGDWHYAVAPLNWAGDWSTMIGQNLEFFFKTDQPAYGSVVEISNISEKRLILAASSLTLYPGASAAMSVTLSEKTPTGLAVSLDSYDSGCVEIPASVVISANQNRAEFTATIPATAGEGCFSVITASADGFGSARLTIKVKERNEQAVLNGRVTDAVTGVGIVGATVSIAGRSTTTGADGAYELTDIPTDEVTANFSAEPRSGDTPLAVQFTDLSGSSMRTLTVSATGYITYESPISLNPGATLSMNISLSPVITDNEFRFVLNWAATPTDLDIYLLVPAFESYAAQNVYYSNRGWFNQYPWALLDIDRRQGFGPETITLQKLISGKYLIFVHNYSRDAALTESGGVVQIYGKAGLLQTVTVPPSGEGPYWQIGELDGDTGQLTIRNVIVSEQPRLGGGGLAKTVAKITSLAEITSWQWDFDDDGTIDATVRNPLYTYNAPGSYTVKLTVSDGVNTYSERKENYITATAPTPDVSGFSVAITNIDISNFPLVKCFVSVIDDATRQPASNLMVTNFDVKEELQEVSSLTIRPLDRTSGARADIVYVFDTTGSMGDEIETVKNRALAFADSLAISGIDYRLGLVTFGDEIRSIHDFTASAFEFKTWIEGLIADGGGDTKENALEGLAAATRLSFREMTQKIVILISDADYHEQAEPGDGTTTFTTESLISLMNEQITQVNVVGPNLRQYNQMAENTGGQFYPIDGDFSAIIRRIGDWITSQYVVTYVPQNAIADNTLRHVKIKVISGDKGGDNSGAYFIGGSRLVLNPPAILGKNGESFAVDVRVENVTNMSMGQWVINFDNTKVQGVSVIEGDFLAQNGAGTAFIQEIKNLTGQIEFSASRLAISPEVSAGASGSGLLARITFKVLTQECNSQLSFQTVNFQRPDSSTLTLITAGAQLRSIGAVGASELTCDFDQDLDIDTRDFALLATYWKPRNLPIGDVGPATGEPPLMVANPDGVVDHEDLFVFTRMWNWYHGAVASPGGLAKSSGAGYRWQEQTLADGTKRMTLLIDHIEKLAMGRIVLRYNAEAFTHQLAREGSLLTADGSSAALLAEEKSRGQIDVTFARLTAVGKPSEVFGSGALLTLDFKQKSGDTLGLVTENIDLRSARNQPVYIKSALDQVDESPVKTPQSYSLVSHPNPFNSRTVIEFALPQAGAVKLTVVNILGQPVRDLIDQNLEAGVHKIAWDGCDDDGTSVVTGMYLIRLQTTERQLTRKILYLK